MHHLFISLIKKQLLCDVKCQSQRNNISSIFITSWTHFPENPDGCGTDYFIKRLTWLYLSYFKLWAACSLASLGFEAASPTLVGNEREDSGRPAERPPTDMSAEERIFSPNLAHSSPIGPSPDWLTDWLTCRHQVLGETAVLMHLELFYSKDKIAGVQPRHTNESCIPILSFSIPVFFL